MLAILDGLFVLYFKIQSGGTTIYEATVSVANFAPTVATEVVFPIPALGLKASGNHSMNAVAGLLGADQILAKPANAAWLPVS